MRITKQQTRRRRLGAISTEYVMVVAVVVIPLAMMLPKILEMIYLYTNRVITVIWLPFG